MNKERAKKIKGIKIKTLNTVIIIISCVLYVLLIFITAAVSKNYQQMVEYTDDYISCRREAAMVYQASDYLTEQVRLYVQNMDIKYMNLYFDEANKIKRREKALAELKDRQPAEKNIKELEAALSASNDLMKTEIYSMRLISEANNYDPEMLPEEVRKVSLKASDETLSSKAKIEKARNLVFDEDYQNAKARIYSNLSNFLDDIMSETSDRQQGSTRALEQSILKQRIFISALFILNILTFIAIILLVINPLSSHIRRVKENETLDIIGAYEFKYLALTYNELYEFNSANEKKLVQKAEHDPLTGLLNRAAFEKVREFFKESKNSIAMAVTDVDQFKQVNDRNGHEAGDAVLKAVAAAIRRSFRPGDYVIRMGGDEFVIIMTGIDQENLGVIRSKFKEINTQLNNAENDFPPVTLSAGVAFSDEGFPDDLFERADKALYDAKNGGRSRCCIEGE